MYRLLQVLILLSCAVATPTSAAIFWVGSGAGCGFADVQAAVNAAQANGAGSDTIRIARNRTYSAQHIVVQNHSVALTGGFADCTTNAVTAPYTTLSGSGGVTDSVIELLGSSGDLVLLNLLVSGGDTAASAQGGGIAVSGGPHVVTLINVTVQANRAGSGGGIAIDSSSHGAIQLNVDANVFIVANEATNGDGGGIYCHESILRYIVASGRIINNTATRNGGGLRADNCTVTLAGGDAIGLFAFNQAGESGGGLSVKGDSADVSIYTRDAAAPTRFFGNTALTGSGGAIEVRNGAQVALFDVNLVDNSAPDGAAASVFDNDGAPNALLKSNLGFRPQGSLYCDPPVACSVVSGNVARDQNGAPTTGAAAISVQAQFTGTASADIRRSSFSGNSGNFLLSSSGGQSSLALTTIAAFGNTAVASLINGFGLDIADSSFGANSVGAASIINGQQTTTQLRRIAAMQAGKRLATQIGGGAIDGQELVANDLTGIPATTNNLQTDPLFVSTTNLRLQPASLAIDYSAATSRDGFDLDGRLRPFDSLQIVNRFGALDIGAFETTEAPPFAFADGFED